MSKDCVDSIKDPHWPDLPPVSCLGVSTHFLHGAGAHQKNHVAILVLALKTQTLMPKILRCDPEGVRQVLALLENDTAGKSGLLKIVHYDTIVDTELCSSLKWGLYIR